MEDGPGGAAEPQYHEQSLPQQEELPPTSRICVKNLPKHVDEHRLKEHFSTKGEVTDVKVMRTGDGRSRCFGFVGFRSSEEADGAVRYFNKTFLDTMRLVVEFAYKYGAAAERPQQPWSKYTDGTSAHKRLLAAEGKGANGEPLGEKAAPLKAREAKKRAKLGREGAGQEVDPKLAEFMALMQPRSKQAIWSNDDTAAAAAAAAGLQPPGGAAAAAQPREDPASDGSDDEEYQELPSRGGGGGGATSDGEASDDEGAPGDALVANAAVSDMDYLRSRVRRDFDADEPAGSDEEDEDEDEDGSGSSGSEDDAAGAGNIGEDEPAAAPAPAARAVGDSDAIDAIFGDRPPGAAPPPDDGSGEAAWRRRPAAAVATDDGAAEAPPAVVIAETGRLFIRNLPYTAADDDLRAAFEAYGQVEDAHVVVDKGTRRSKGFAMVQFAAAEDAVAAFTALDGSIFMGRLLHVLPGKRAPEPAPAAEGDGAAAGDGEEGAPRGGGTSSYKRQREGELKASAGNRAAWNSLFMRADTVAEAVAAHYGVTKAELLDPTAADMAVRLALGETHVIAETKAALDQAGVDVAKLEEAAASAARGKGAAAAAAAGRGADAPRSDRVLLVKNLPFSASEGDLEALFGGVGSLARVALPPTRTLALVEFVEAKDAKRAFQSLAYKRFHHVPLYLEWAPAGIFSKPPAPAKPAAAAPAAPAARAAKKEAAKKETAAAAGLGAPAEDDDSVESSSIFVKNLAWATEDAALGAHFAAAAAAAGGALRAATVAKRKTKEGKFLSAGFGFVECSDEGVARAVIAALQGSSLDGHSLVLQLSQAAARGGEAKPAAPLGGAAQETTKVVVRNVAFEATRKDILGLFTPFGHVKSCRLPRKFDGSHRGFAFVDFSTRQEARAAVEAVAGTHLYGRRLVIEWAEADGGLEELRSKTAAKFRGEAVALLSGGGAGGEERGSGGEEGEEEPQQQQPERKKRRRGRD